MVMEESNFQQADLQKKNSLRSKSNAQPWLQSTTTLPHVVNVSVSHPSEDVWRVGYLSLEKRDVQTSEMDY